MRLFRRLRARFGLALQSDTAFIEAAFREILGREPDLDGLNHYRRVLRDGVGRTAVLLSIVRSEEFTGKLVKAVPALPNLRGLRPDRYRESVDRTNGERLTLFDVLAPADVDWLEQAILQHGYYEKPGVWNLGIDTDKRVAAEIVASFAPSRALEVGCAAGAVLECLDDLGVQAEGVEISGMAIQRAAERVRARIHAGDLLSLDLNAASYDVVFGLDVFEHLNPNRLDAYVARLVELVRDGGYAFCNIPAFGEDRVFGTVFPFYVDGWERDAAARRVFAAIHCDDLGYPIHGHLTWADARWWVERFERAGLTRAVEIERALHAKYDAYMARHSPARRAFFVFGRNASPEARAMVVARVSRTPSAALS